MSPAISDLGQICTLDLSDVQIIELRSIYSQFTNDLVSPTGQPLSYPGEDDDEAYCCDADQRSGCTITSDCSCVAATGNFYTENGLLNLDALPPNLPLVECGQLCSCAVISCPNRVTQRKTIADLRIKSSGLLPKKGLVCLSLHPLQAGTFITLYSGHLLTTSQVRARRQKRAEEHPEWGNYTLSLRENGRSLGFVDATEIGDIGRFLNHSCDPNCFVQLVRWGPRAFPRPAIFTRRNVAAEEELTWDYANASCDRNHEPVIAVTAHNKGQGSSTYVQLTTCLCGANGCRGFLPFDGE